MKTDIHPIEVVILCAVAVLWAAATITRCLLIPCLALVAALVSRRPAPSPQPAPVVAQPSLTPVSLATLATIAEELQSLPGARLRAITGCRRKVAKRAMVDAWLAMPI